jgi:hypothetical protein
MEMPRVFVDFHNADVQGRLRLNAIGTIEDLARHGIVLSEGQRLVFHSEDLEVEGQVHFSPDEQLWVAIIDWNAIRHAGAFESESGSGESAA